ncbi:hypothetical protein DPMN_187353 [Dreissena polymorpha]|uniref:Uncharacterized protein n=1 Tax=Dreissena polymorpha TaxID=45954 RepID=A0A9D4IAC7_DREPO|nr:hypothetical protein DPMN_187353 [Dreissena polymorpha]
MDDFLHCRQRTDDFFEPPYLELHPASHDIRLQEGYLGGQLGLYPGRRGLVYSFYY